MRVGYEESYLFFRGGELEMQESSNQDAGCGLASKLCDESVWLARLFCALEACRCEVSECGKLQVRDWVGWRADLVGLESKRECL